MKNEKLCKGDVDCQNCEIDDSIICKVDPKRVRNFVLGNITYRTLAIVIFSLVGILSSQWWWLITYAGILALTFLVIEPLLLCRHCPFYTKPGKTLKCWALRGMPKLWKYDPSPTTKFEKRSMVILGAFIDLFPFIGVIFGIIYFILTLPESIIIGVSLIVITVIFAGVVYYFSKVLLGDACKRCPNLSCSMNKVPKAIADKFLRKNPQMIFIDNGEMYVVIVAEM
ncbi:MAG: hypothetical protein P8Y70_00325, partial [Candidatus Lokiarchaeota archaeon]